MYEKIGHFPWKGNFPWFGNLALIEKDLCVSKGHKNNILFVARIISKITRDILQKIYYKHFIAHQCLKAYIGYHCLDFLELFVIIYLLFIATLFFVNCTNIL